MECLERTLLEMDALEAIFGSSGIEQQESAGSTGFTVITQDALKLARGLMESSYDDEKERRDIAADTIEIEIKESFEGLKQSRAMTMRCRLPWGYPDTMPAIVSMITVSDLTRTARDEISMELNKEAENLVGQEAILELHEIFKQLVGKADIDDANAYISHDAPTDIRQLQKSAIFGRRWIWVHHITNLERRKMIVKEATGLNLGGYLKSGYPGVIVIEGRANNCDEFVAWVKGNKSRPGGFGRNWGHHVRGHLDFDEESYRKFNVVFEELNELALFAKCCKERGVEDEFLEYVMQHKGSS